MKLFLVLDIIIVINNLTCTLLLDYPGSLKFFQNNYNHNYHEHVIHVCYHEPSTAQITQVCIINDTTCLVHNT